MMLGDWSVFCWGAGLAAQNRIPSQASSGKATRKCGNRFLWSQE